MRDLDPRYRSGSKAPSLELVLRLQDGRPWRLTVATGMERFIGYYPRVDGLDAGGPLLRFRAVSPV
ncbi:MAG: hypothetical protein ABIW83_08485 [Allosphingosinicella sp.]